MYDVHGNAWLQRKVPKCLDRWLICFGGDILKLRLVGAEDPNQR